MLLPPATPNAGRKQVTEKERRREAGENLPTAAKPLWEKMTDRPKGLSDTADGPHSPYSCLHRPHVAAGSQRGASRADRRAFCGFLGFFIEITRLWRSSMKPVIWILGSFLFSSKRGGWEHFFDETIGEGGCQEGILNWLPPAFA